MPMTRRGFLATSAAIAAAALVPAHAAEPFHLNYVLSSAMYGTTPLDAILPEVSKVGATGIDVWCKPHGDQREQITAMGEEAFAELLKQHRTKLAMTTQYALGPFKLADELKFLKRMGGKLVVTGTPKASDPSGEEAKTGVKAFLETMKPHVAAADEAGVTIALENHAGWLISHPDAIKYFAEFNTSPHLGIAFAPHHLHQWTDQIPSLITALGKNLAFFYAQEFGMGFMQKLPKEDEMKQMPGYGGGLDYRPIAAALKKIRYTRMVEILMHPTPRGIPILPTTPQVTAAINKSRAYLDECAAAA
jgi:sugar phosphate isomerase/epimerase